MELEQLNFPKRHWEEQRICDGCEIPFDNGDKAVVYFCDTVWNHFAEGDLPNIVPQGMYCWNCYPRDIPLPHLGTNEGFLFVINEYETESDEYSYEKKEVIKGSPRTRGIEWTPIELVEDLYPAPRGMIQHNITPLSVFFTFERLGIDLRGFVKDNELFIPEAEIEKIELILESNTKHQPHSIWSPEML